MSQKQYWTKPKRLRTAEACCCRSLRIRQSRREHQWQWHKYLEDWHLDIVQTEERHTLGQESSEHLGSLELFLVISIHHLISVILELKLSESLMKKRYQSWAGRGESRQLSSRGAARTLLTVKMRKGEEHAWIKFSRRFIRREARVSLPILIARSSRLFFCAFWLLVVLKEKFISFILFYI